MKVALLGYGRMGKAIEKVAKNRGHQIVCTVDAQESTGSLNEADAAINFSVPEAALLNISSALELGIPVVCGTTGWLDQKVKAEILCKEKETAFLYASNFSIGVNLFFALNKNLAEFMKKHPSYKVAVEETHHIHKLDAPSGTAITLAEDIIEKTHLEGWETAKNPSAKNQLPIQSHREGEVPGIHQVEYSSPIDSIKIRHEAYNRLGFAFGAVIAAEWILGKKGVFGMEDVLNLSQ